MRRRLQRAAACALLLIGTLSLAQQRGLEVAVSVRPETVREGESLRVAIEVTGSAAKDARFEGRAPEGTLLVPASGVSVNQQISWVNGQYSATKSFVIEYLATRAGPGRVPAFTIVSGSERHRTEPVEVRILARGAAAPAGSAATDDAELSIDARLDRSQIFLGESVTLEYVLRTRVSIRGFEPQRLEPVPGFLIEDAEIEPQATERTSRDAQGRTWREFVLHRRLLTPTRSGSLVIPGTPFAFVVTRGSRGMSFFSREERVARFVAERSLTVLPLPEEGRPDDFTGAVGRFKLRAELAAKEVPAGEAVNLVATLEGEQPSGALSAPHFNAPQDVQVFDPLEEREGAQRRRWIFPIVPRTPGEIVLEGVHLSYFDPGSRRYESLAAGPFTLRVSGEAQTATEVLTGSPGRVRAQATDLRFIHTDAERALQRAEGGSVGSAGVWFLALLPLALVPALLVGDGLLQSWSSSAGGRRARIAREVGSHLRAAERLAALDTSEAGRELLLALHAWASGVLGRSTRSLERAQLRRALAERFDDAEVADDAVRLVDEAEALRYAGGADERGARRVLDEVRSLVGRREGRR